MLKQLPVKKEYLLVVAVLVLLLACYKLAFQQTLEAWQTNRQLKAQLTRSADLSYQPGYLGRKNTNLDRIIDLYKADTVAFRNSSISEISIIAEKEGVKLSDVPTEDPLFHGDKFIIQKLDFEGSFFSMMKTLNDLQTADNVGIIRSVAYKLVPGKTNMDEDKKLVMEVYLEIAR